MQRGKIGYTAAVMVMLAVMIASVYALFRNARADNDQPQIAAEQAKQICLSDSGEVLAEVTFTRARLDWENRIPVYKIDFYTAEKSYEYDVNAQTGIIRNREVVLQRRTEMPRDPGKTADSEEETHAVHEPEDVIGVLQAQEAALEAAEMNRNQVSFLQTSLETDAGGLVYEVEFIFEGREYEYTIDAFRGVILEEEIEIPEKEIPFTEEESGSMLRDPAAADEADGRAGDDDDDREDDDDDREDDDDDREDDDDDRDDDDDDWEDDDDDRDDDDDNRDDDD